YFLPTPRVSLLHNVLGNLEKGQGLATSQIVLGVRPLPVLFSTVILKVLNKPSSSACSTGGSTCSFLKSLATIHEIEAINAAGFLPGLRLGYLMCDTCASASKALQGVGHMLQVNGSLNVICDYSDFRPTVKIVLGALYSEVSIAVARLMNVYMVPLLSSTSSAPDLSNKQRYPSFLRTVPSDEHQTRAVARMMHHFGWNWVGVVYGDDAYGSEAFHSFLGNAEANDVCLAYQEVLPHYLDDSLSLQSVKRVAKVIRSSGAQVVLLILKAELVELLFKEMIGTNTSRIWISTDTWTKSKFLSEMKGINEVGDILGFTFVSEESEPFNNYLKNLTATPGGYNRFIEEYKNLRFNCNPQVQNDDYLVRALDTGETFLYRAAVWATANALKKLLKCNSSSCSGDINFPPWKLLEELKKVEFEFENHYINFDKNGDFLSYYNLIMWERDGHSRRFQNIGKYQVLDKEIEVDKNFTWFSTANTTIPPYRCSDHCAPGSVKKILNVSCCYNCTLCVEGTFSDAPDLATCKACPNGTWALKGWTQCGPRSESYLRWTEAHPIIMIAAAVFGILLLFVTAVIFLVYRDSPPMKRAEVRLSCVMMVGLSVSFASVICFMGKPNIHLCRARQLLYALGFTLCVSCILVKAYRTFLAFLPFGQLTCGRLHKLYKPAALVIGLTALQGVICLLWLILDSPDIDPTPPSPQSMIILIQCSEGATHIGFGVMLVYIALLALVGFFLAAKGRKVPQEFSETGYIIFSMLMYLFVWVCFIPVYITNHENAAIVQATAILVSTYGVIFCHFLPKSLYCMQLKAILNEKCFYGLVSNCFKSCVHLFFFITTKLSSTADLKDNVLIPSPTAPPTCCSPPPLPPPAHQVLTPLQLYRLPLPHQQRPSLFWRETLTGSLED
uniref:Olfactory receptor C family, b1 n=1 Tax=Gasterosteus aculeatus aculeatus TaxID=481459 RepID=G3PF77_GASAC